jgi:hypothetical protein
LTLKHNKHQISFWSTRMRRFIALMPLATLGSLLPTTCRCAKSSSIYTTSSFIFDLISFTYLSRFISCCSLGGLNSRGTGFAWVSWRTSGTGWLMNLRLGRRLLGEIKGLGSVASVYLASFGCSRWPLR